MYLRKALFCLAVVILDWSGLKITYVLPKFVLNFLKVRCILSHHCAALLSSDGLGSLRGRRKKGTGVQKVVVHLWGEKNSQN